MWPALLFCVGIISYAHGSCHFNQISVELTESGRHRYICEYTPSNSGLTKGAEIQTTLKVLPGSRFTTTDCVSCECSIEGLQCCGIGRFAGVFVPPDGCVFIADGCNQLLVKRSNSSLDCLTGHPITNNASVMTSNGRALETGNTILKMSGPMSVTDRQKMETFNSMVEQRFNGGIFGFANQLKPDQINKANEKMSVVGSPNLQLPQDTAGNTGQLLQEPQHKPVQLVQNGAALNKTFMTNFSQPNQVDFEGNAILRRQFEQPSSALTSVPPSIPKGGIDIPTASGKPTEPVKVQSQSILQDILNDQHKQPLTGTGLLRPRSGIGSFIPFDD